MKTGEIIKKFILEEFVPNGQDREISEEDSLITSGVIDSMGIINLLAFLEEEFAIEISSEELMPENFETLSAITAMVDQKIG